MSSKKTASDKPGGRSMEEVLFALARRMRSERERQGVSQEDSAEVRVLHRTAIGLLERDKSIPRLDMLLQVAQRPGLTVSELVRGIES